MRNNTIELIKENKRKEPQKRINLVLDEKLVLEIREIIKKLLAKGDFTYPSFTEFLRQAIIAYQQGMKIDSEEFNKGIARVQFTVRLEERFANFHQSFAHGYRSPMLDKILKAYLKKTGLKK